MIRSSGDPLRQLAAAYRALDSKQRGDVRKALNSATKDAKQVLRTTAAEVLPHRGGLGSWVADSRYTTQTRFGGRDPRITITQAKTNKVVHPRRAHRKAAASRGRGHKKFFDHSGRGYSFGKRGDLRAINNGRVWHPYWGRAPHERNAGIQLIPGRLGLGGRGYADVAADRIGTTANEKVLDAIRGSLASLPTRIS